MANDFFRLAGIRPTTTPRARRHRATSRIAAAGPFVPEDRLAVVPGRRGECAGAGGGERKRACRSADRRRRRQRHRHRARCRRARPQRRAVRAGRSCPAHLVGQHQADPRRVAVSRALRVPAGAHGVARARAAAAGRPAHHPAAALRPAARPPAAAGLADPPRAPAVRPSGRAPRAAGSAHGRSHARSRRAAAEGGTVRTGSGA